MIKQQKFAIGALLAALLAVPALTQAATEVNPANGQPLTAKQKAAQKASQEAAKPVEVNPANGQPLTAKQKAAQKKIEAAQKKATEIKKAEEK